MSSATLTNVAQKGLRTKVLTYREPMQQNQAVRRQKTQK